MATKFRKILKDYMINSTIAGLHYIAEDGRHWTERSFWILCVAISWYLSWLMIAASWFAFQHNSISFGVETVYIDWDTYFPAIGVCENENLNRVYDASDNIWTPVHAIDLEEVLKELAYFRGTSYYTLQYCNRDDADPLCPKDNFTFYAHVVRGDCKNSLGKCSYNEDIFDCCDYFDDIETDIGKCFIINSVQSNNPDAKRYRMVNNKIEGLGRFKMELLTPARLYTLGEEEVPALTTLQSDFFTAAVGNKYRRHIAVRNIENDPLVRETSIEQRKCRFWDENVLDVYPHYSYSACTVQCRNDAQLRMCNCTDHFMPNADPKLVCNMDGLICLNKLYLELSVLKPPWANRSGLVCECLPSCEETEITTIKDETFGDESGIIHVEINMEYLPTERFKRNVVRSRLDLVVSMGGTAGLFVGASLLSLVELVYYFAIRYFGTMHMAKKRRRLIQRSVSGVSIPRLKRTKRDFDF